MSDLDHRGKVGEYKPAAELAKELLPGDLIEMNRLDGKFQHWGVCIQADGGKAVIINVNGDVGTGLGAVLGARQTVADIRVEDLLGAVGADPARYNNSIDLRFDPYTANEIVRRGLGKVGQHDYSVWSNNCEHWASWCRNGNLVSVQSQKMHKLTRGPKTEPTQQENVQKELDKKKEDHDSKLAQLKEKAEEKLADLKAKISKGPPKPEAVKLPADVLEKFPALKKFEGNTDDMRE